MRDVIASDMMKRSLSEEDAGDGVKWKCKTVMACIALFPTYEITNIIYWLFSWKMKNQNQKQ